MTTEQFNIFNKMSKEEIIEDISHRVGCDVPLFTACKEVAQEQEKVGQILNPDSLRKKYNRRNK